MQKVAELLAELETALDDCSKWAGGTECRQNANGYEREYSLTALVNVLQWLDAAAHGQPLTAEQEQDARRIISLTRWHPAEGKAISFSGTRPAHSTGSAGNSAGNGRKKPRKPAENGKNRQPAEPPAMA